MSARDTVASLRETPSGRRAALLAAVFVGLAIAQIHWIGFVIGGVAVGLAARSVPRALLGGLAFGVFAWLVFLSLLAADGVAAAYLSTGEVALVTLAIPLGGSLLGSLVRFGV